VHLIINTHNYKHEAMSGLSMQGPRYEFKSGGATYFESTRGEGPEILEFLLL